MSEPLNDPITLWLALQPPASRQALFNVLAPARRSAIETELQSIDAIQALTDWKLQRQARLRPAWVHSRDALMAVPARLHPLLWPLLQEFLHE
jgi:hypothetical protein